MIKLKLKNIIESQDSRAGYIFDIFIYSLIILSLLAFSIETIPSLNKTFKYYLDLFEIITVSIFTLEYILRFYVSDKKIRYIFSFYGIIDILAILPFYLSGVKEIDLRSLRLLRLLRVLRLFKLLRGFNNSFILLKKAFYHVRREITIFSFIAVILLYISSVGIYYFENKAH